MFKERHDNKITMLTFGSAAPEYQFIFNEIREAYLNMIGQPGMLGVEELWIYLIEAVYQKIPSGHLIFED